MQKMHLSIFPHGVAWCLSKSQCCVIYVPVAFETVFICFMLSMKGFDDQVLTGRILVV